MSLSSSSSGCGCCGYCSLKVMKSEPFLELLRGWCTRYLSSSCWTCAGSSSFWTDCY